MSQFEMRINTPHLRTGDDAMVRGTLARTNNWETQHSQPACSIWKHSSNMPHVMIRMTTAVQTVQESVGAALPHLAVFADIFSCCVYISPFLKYVVAVLIFRLLYDMFSPHVRCDRGALQRPRASSPVVRDNLRLVRDKYMCTRIILVFMYGLSGCASTMCVVFCLEPTFCAATAKRPF